jgi:hypothetical protein
MRHRLRSWIPRTVLGSVWLHLRDRAQSTCDSHQDRQMTKNPDPLTGRDQPRRRWHYWWPWMANVENTSYAHEMVNHGTTIRPSARHNRTLVTKTWETVRCLHDYAIIVFNRKKTNTHKIKVGTDNPHNQLAWLQVPPRKIIPAR